MSNKIHYCLVLVICPATARTRSSATLHCHLPFWDVALATTRSKDAALLRLASVLFRLNAVHDAQPDMAKMA